jgi:hypothetical protein
MVAFQLNSIAKGYDNPTGLVNIENIEVNGFNFVAVRDINTYQSGQLITRGDGLGVEDGYPFQNWELSYLSNAQKYYLRTSILGGNISGPVTFKAQRYGVPVADGMTAPHIIANGILTLQHVPKTRQHTDGETHTRYVFTRIRIIEEDMFFGNLKVTGGAVSQDDIGTTPEKLTAFDTNGLYNAVTVSSTDDSLTVLVAAKWRPMADIEFTSVGAATTWTFMVYKNGVATGITRTVLASAGYISFVGEILDLAADDILTIYINSDDGTALSDITVVEGSFMVHSISTV